MWKNMSKKQNKTWEGERSGNSQRNSVMAQLRTRGVIDKREDGYPRSCIHLFSDVSLGQDPPVPFSQPTCLEWVDSSLSARKGLTNQGQCNWFNDRQVLQTGSIRVSPRILVGNGGR